jgi:MraZ protein
MVESGIKWGIVGNMLLTGTYPRTLDEKNRLTLPRRIREQLGDVPRLYLTPGQDRCLWLFRQNELEQLAARMDQGPATVFRRLFFSRTEDAPLDGHGRILIPDRLSNQAGLKKEVFLLGVQDHLEVWDAGRWEEYVGQHTPRFDAVAEQAFRK